MSALSAASTKNLGTLGNVRMMLVRFTSVSTGDTYASGLKNIISAIPVCTSVQSTQTSGGINCSISGATITLKPSEDAVQVDLFILTRS